MLQSKIYKSNYIPRALILYKKTLDNKTKSCAGFTIIEVSVALAILIFSITYLIVFLPTGIKSSSSARDKTVAVNLARTKIEEIISKPYSENAIGATVENSLSYLGDDFSKYKRTTVINYVDQNLNNAVSDIGLKKAAVSVSWLDPLSGYSTTTLTTLITPL